MAKDENWLETLLKAAAVIGGAWLGLEILKAIAKKEEYYTCPNCMNDIKFGNNKCSRCGVTLKWETKK